VPARPSTARSKLVETLTEEILGQPGKSAYPIASEHELCRRFNLSRVTVRLALSDLENRGLIFRRHGKGTFAHGCAGRLHRHVGILMRPSSSEDRGTAEFVRGVQSVQAEMGAGVLLISISPEEWRPEVASALSGVLVLSPDVSGKELSVLRDRNLPFLLLGEAELAGPRIILDGRDDLSAPVDKLHLYFAAGQSAAKALTHAAQTGKGVTDLLVEPELAPAAADGFRDGASGFGERLQTT
jgi:hypothetical protein